MDAQTPPSNGSPRTRPDRWTRRFRRNGLHLHRWTRRKGPQTLRKQGRSRDRHRTPPPQRLRRVRLAHIDTATRKDHLLEFIEENILPGTILYTDGEAAYNAIPKRLDITHERIVLMTSTAAAHDLLPGVHRVAALLKRWLTGTLHDGQSAAQLAYYLDEFTFRFNRRASRSRGLLWYRLIQQALNTDPHPYNAIISH